MKHKVLDVLAEYEVLHPNALIEARRDHYDFIEIRIIDPDFQGMERISRRENKVWPLLYSLPDEIISDIMGLVLVTPEEAPHFGPSIEFDHPLPPLPILDQAQNSPSSPYASQSPTTPLSPAPAAHNESNAHEGAPQPPYPQSSPLNNEVVLVSYPLEPPIKNGWEVRR